MRQEHPFFSRPQIYFGKPIDEEEMLEEGLSLGDMRTQSAQDKTGLFFLWTEDFPSEESISLLNLSE